MSEFKGTKGKWVLNNHVIESDLGCDIVEVWDYNDEENQANALLISKAPELLEGVIEALKFSKMKDNEVMVEYFEQLIRQATEL